ncbi:MAG: SDR family oxidoreductase [Verrucomicrobiae bacterium]|nr:SDR family oxidoreductase [Verrucomicrobiae bacterium]
MKLFDLSGEVATVIGASGVIGGAIAEGLAEAGAKVAVIARSPQNGEARTKSIRDKGGAAAYFKADATETAQLREACAAIEKQLGPTSVLVNCAGGNDSKTTITPENPFEKIPLEAWKANYHLNLVGGALLPCQIFGPGMLARKKGSIINIASVSAHLPLSRVASYSAAKASVVNLSMFLAREWGSRGIRVNTITPGFFPADQNKALLFQEDGAPTERTRSIWLHTPMGRFGDASELVGAAIFLASPRASSFVTGADLRVDGGFLCQTI